MRKIEELKNFSYTITFHLYAGDRPTLEASEVLVDTLVNLTKSTEEYPRKLPLCNSLIHLFYKTNVNNFAHNKQAAFGFVSLVSSTLT